MISELDGYRTNNKFQAALREKNSAANNINNLVSIVHLNFAQNKKTYAFFVDKLLFTKLYTLRISTKLVNFIQVV